MKNHASASALYTTTKPKARRRPPVERFVRPQLRSLGECLEPRWVLSTLFDVPVTPAIASDWVSARSEADEFAVPQSSTLGDLESYLPMPLPVRDESAVSTPGRGEPISYNFATRELRVGEAAFSDASADAFAALASVHEAPRDSGPLPLSDATPGSPGARTLLSSESDVRTPKNFTGLSWVSNQEDWPWRGNVKLFMNFPDNNYVCSGTLISPRHVLTAGHCVNDGDGGPWANSITVAPAYENGAKPFGDAQGVEFHSWSGWTDDGDWDDDLGVIDLDRPVGALTGWYGYGYNDSPSFYTDNHFSNPGYPADSPYNGQWMYNWHGDFDGTDSFLGVWYGNEVSIDSRSYGGQSGSGAHSDSQIVYAVLSNGNDSTTWFPRITSDKYGHIGGFIAADTPSSVDLIPLEVQVTPTSIGSGNAFSNVSFVVHNNSSASWSGTVNYRVYLSTNDIISTGDTLLGTYSFTHSFGPKSSVTRNPLNVTIPASMAGGSYHVGVFLDFADANSGNNYTDGQDAAPVTVLNPDLAGYDTYVPSQIAWGQAFTLDGQVRNFNSVPVTADFYQQFYLSNDQIWGDADDVSLGYYYHSADVAAGGFGPDFQVSLSLPSTPPAGYTGLGPFYVGMLSDAPGYIAETNEFNNGPGDFSQTFDWDSFTIPPTYDLRGWDTYVPEEIAWGQAFTLNGQVYNSGNSAITPSFTQKFYLSNDSTWGDADDVYLGEYLHTADVPAGGFGPDFTVPLALPAVAPSGYSSRGPYRIGMLSDANGNISESDETNNGPGDFSQTYDWDSFLLPATYELSGYWTNVAPDVAPWGDTFDVYMQVYNGGNEATPVAFTQKFYLSNDQTWGDADDVYLGEYLHASAAPAGGFGPGVNVPLALPSTPPAGYLGGGPFYVGMLTDANNAITETDETNNGPGDLGQTYDWDLFLTEKEHIRIVDNADAGNFSVSGTWGTGSVGFNGTNRWAAPGAGASAAWTFSGVEPGLYRVAATWSEQANRATDALYQIRDGVFIEGSASVNQQQRPSDFIENNVGWRYLGGTYDLSSATLTVHLNSSAAGYVIADAVRLERVDQPSAVKDDGDIGFALTNASQWGTGALGFQDDNRWAPPGTGTRTATWTFAVEPGLYRVAATWGAAANRASNAPYTIRDGAVVERVVKVDQRQTPADFTDNNTGWRYLGGTYEINGTNLSVMLADVASGYVVADAVRIEKVATQIRTRDDGEAGFAVNNESQWGTGMVGFEDDNRWAAAGDGSRTATWTFTVEPGLYRVAATWGATSNRATNAPYTIRDGATVERVVKVNQQQVPHDFTESNVGWRYLGGAFQIDTTTLSVTLSNDANGYVVADGVRLEKVPAVVRTRDDGEAGFALNSEGDWGTGALGFEDDNRWAPPGTGTRTATWTFDVEPGWYRAATTWGAAANRATNAPYTIRDGAAVERVVKVNQRQAPTDFTESNVGWRYLGGAFYIDSTTLSVQLTDNADGYVIADGLRIERVAARIQTRDDGETGFVLNNESQWGTGALGFEDDNRWAPPGTGERTATYTFAGIEPGVYRVAATWGAAANRATNAPYALLDGANSLGVVRVNQQQPPADFVESNVGWRWLAGTFEVFSTTLTVQLSNDANGYVIADGVRIERVASFPNLVVFAASEFVMGLSPTPPESGIAPVPASPTSFATNDQPPAVRSQAAPVSSGANTARSLPISGERISALDVDSVFADLELDWRKPGEDDDLAD